MVFLFTSQFQRSTSWLFLGLDCRFARVCSTITPIHAFMYGLQLGILWLYVRFPRTKKNPFGINKWSRKSIFLLQHKYHSKSNARYASEHHSQTVARQCKRNLLNANKWICNIVNILLCGTGSWKLHGTQNTIVVQGWLRQSTTLPKSCMGRRQMQPSLVRQHKKRALDVAQ